MLHLFIILVVQQTSLSSKDCSTQILEKLTTEPLQLKKPPGKLHKIFQHLDKENSFQHSNKENSCDSKKINLYNSDFSY